MMHKARWTVDDPVVGRATASTKMRSRGFTSFTQEFSVEGSKSFVSAADGCGTGCRGRRPKVGRRSINVGDNKFDISSLLASGLP